MQNKLPIKLRKEPLVDALFELRFNEMTHAVDVLPGIIFNELSGEGRIHHIGPYQVPPQIRDQEIGLRYIPVVAIEFEKFGVNIGNRSVSVVCKMPYPGWECFSEFVRNVLSVISKAKISPMVNRFSLKYTNLIESDTVEDQIKMLNANFSLNDNIISNSDINFKVDLEDENSGYIHLVGYSTSAVVENLDQEKRKGVIVEVDSIYNFDPVFFKDWFDSYDSALAELHNANKKMFFDSISKDALRRLEPIYE